MQLTLLFLYILASIGISDDVGLNFIEIVADRGYPLDRHWVTTEDGYILGLFRMPYSPYVQSTSDKKPVILLWHALLDSSYAFVCQSRNQSIAYLLADAGYDVWFANVRGNTWSRNHTTLNPDDKKDGSFWQYSMDEHIKFDVPSTINYILDFTQAATLDYIGHSQGTTIAFGAFSTYPELAAKITNFIAWGPAFHVTHQTSTLIKIVADLDIDELLRIIGSEELLPSNDLIRKFAPSFCSALPHGCDIALEAICGPAKNMDEDRIAVYVSQTPAGSSVKNLVHWGQTMRSKEKFTKYDYGCGFLTCKNKEVYGQRTPPIYDIKKLNVPTSLFYGADDDLADPQDVQFLLDNLPNLKFSKLIQNFAHLDFTWGSDANRLVYDDVFKILNSKTDKNTSFFKAQS